MRAFYAPLLWIEVVGAVAYVFYKAQRHVFMGYQYVSLGRAMASRLKKAMAEE